MRSKGLDGGIWSAFWLAVLGNSVDFLSVFFVCDSDSYILNKNLLSMRKETSNLTSTFSSAVELKSKLKQT